MMSSVREVWKDSAYGTYSLDFLSLRSRLESSVLGEFHSEDTIVGLSSADGLERMIQEIV